MALQVQVEIAAVAISNDERAFFIELSARLPKTRQRFVMDVLDSMLAQAGR